MDIEQIIQFAQSLDESKESVDQLYEHLLAQFELERPEERTFQRNGLLMTFDGHSGAGKDTQINFLARALIDHKVVLPIQKKQDPFRVVSKFLWAHHELEREFDPSFLILTCGRRYAVYHDLLPTLEDPEVVVLQNRSYISNVGYHANSPEDIPRLLQISYFDPSADLPFVLECDANIAYQRVVARSPKKGGVIHLNERLKYIVRVTANFRRLTELVPDLILISTTGITEEVASVISSHVTQYLENRI